MAFGAEELRVLRRSLALALHPGSATAEDVQDCLRLAESVDEAARESARLRAFLLADLARYRAALPGTVSGYLALLQDALDAGYRPAPDDLAALRALRGNPAAAALLHRCRILAERGVRARPATRPTAPTSPTDAGPASAPLLLPIPASRTRLLALPGGRAAEGPDGKPTEKPAPAPTPKPTPQKTPRPARPIPTPGEVFPPKRKPGPPATATPPVPQVPPANPPHQLAAG
ncbi:hypothetical protein AB0D78_13040 [Streptomyces avermitilis]|uniref:hypothetical protein n=1 Tax=Streptomyces avermitilis TaxID=33903 RepID=UPI0033C18F02